VPFFRYAMPWEQRVLIATISVLLLAFSGIALCFLGLLVWALFTA
jgi:cytochrome b subunit of formate dehydrogenase